MESELLGLIGDVHAEDRSLRTALAYFDANHVQKVLCVGDIVTGIGDVNACCSMLIEQKIATVRGNHDRWLLAWGGVSMPHGHRLDELLPESQAWLKSLPIRFDLETPIGNALVCHGIGADDMATIDGGSTDEFVLRNTPLGTLCQLGLWKLLIHGHSHRRMVRTINARSSGTITVINAGTLRRDHQPCFAIIDFDALAVRFIDLTPDHDAGTEVVIPLSAAALPYKSRGNHT